MWCSHDAGRCAGTKTGTFQLTANCAASFTTLASSSDAHASISYVASSRRLAHPSLCHPRSAQRGGGRGNGPPACKAFLRQNAIVFVSGLERRLPSGSSWVFGLEPHFQTTSLFWVVLFPSSLPCGCCPLPPLGGAPWNQPVWKVEEIRKSKLPHTGVVGSWFFSCFFGALCLVASGRLSLSLSLSLTFAMVVSFAGGAALGGAFPSCVVLPSHRCFWVLLLSPPPLGTACFLPLFCGWCWFALLLLLGGYLYCVYKKCSSSTVSRRRNFVVRRVCVLYFRDGQSELHVEIS